MRLPVHPGQGGADAALLGAIFLLWCGWCVLMAWDARHGGFAAMPIALQALGGLLLAGGMFGAWRALAANSYASVTVRLQQEREHRLVDTGAYAWVRHPMYGAMLPAFLGIPLLLGSWWGLAGVPGFVALLVLRTRREEALLIAGLPGYGDYMRRVRHRFIPGLW
jgi:protein-S-isoprenylcysteine O-methyltransferase Ste14